MQDHQTFGYDENLKTSNKELISVANTVSLIDIFKYYNIHLDEFNKKTICPFKHHKNGRESSASFNWYPDTNGFWCFGCKTGSTPCDFISNIDGCSKNKAAEKIIELFKNNLNTIIVTEVESYQDKLEIMLLFSNKIREFREIFISNSSFLFIENICKIYDSVNVKHALTNDALQSVIKQLLEKVNNYYE